VFVVEAAATLQGADGRVWSGSEITVACERQQAQWEGLAADEVIGLVGDNSPEWVISDWAALQAGRAVVPIPGFFTTEQIQHVCRQARIRHVVHQGRLLSVQSVYPSVVNFEEDAPPYLPADTQKITFTSGTTGQPKGICLTAQQQLATAQALQTVLGNLEIRTHLNMLPLAVLLENIAGVYVPWALGARVISLPLAQVGLSGSSQFDPLRCIAAIARHQAESVILLPQMLQAIVAVLERQPQLLADLKTLKCVAVGGGVTPLACLKSAQDMGLAVFEGYGLSECASVVSLNTPQAQCLGSVGQPLPGLKVELADDGEIVVWGRSYAGVLGQTEHRTDKNAGLHTGDIGEFRTERGQRFLHITGRKKNILITAFGRNVSPEWPERLLLDEGLLAQAVVLGEGKPALSAVLVRLHTGVTDTDIAQLVARVNAGLPDYARIATWTVVNEAFSVVNGLATPNGRPLRAAIEQKYSFEN
jgi:long-subunit acyl-CoA synthetase (AMP-forming)